MTQLLLNADDGWTNHSAAIQPWQPSTGFCDHSAIGGPTEEDYRCIEDMGLTQADTTAITDAWSATMQDVRTAINEAGGFSWDQFMSINTPDQVTCTIFFKQYCGNASTTQSNAIMHQFTRTANGTFYPLPAFKEDLATFLAVRGPHAWLGYGWLGCSEGPAGPSAGGQPYSFPPELNADYGIPLSYCAETAPGSGVFNRSWSHANVSFDCNAYAASITML